MARPYEWSAVEDSYLMENFGRVSGSSMSKELGRSPSGVSQRLEVLGLRKPTKEYSLRTCQNLCCGQVFSVLRYEIGRGRGQFCSNKCSVTSRCVDVPNKEELVKAYGEGNSTNDLAEKFGISKGTVYNLLKLHGVKCRNGTQSQDVARQAGKLANAGNPVFKGGFRSDLGVKVRSGWEASVLRWLNHEGIAWVYEPMRFEFSEKRGAKSYLPDVWLPEYEGGRWLEVKGRLMSSDKTRIKRFQKHYPEEFAKLVAIPGSPSDEAAKFFEKMQVPILAYFRELDKKYRDVIADWND